MAIYYGPAFGPNFSQTPAQPRQMQSIPGQYNPVSKTINTTPTYTAPTGGGGTAPTAPAISGPNPTTQESLAQDSYNSRLQAIKDQLGVLQGTADRLNGNASAVRDEVLGSIGTTYGGLQTTADTQNTNALGALAENDRGVVRDYANNQGSLNASTEGAVNKNRALARALGFGNSSYYQDTQNQTRTSALDKTAGNLNEQTAKLTAIKGKVADVGTWHAQKTAEIAQEKASLTGQAQREYQDQVATNADLVRNGSISSVDAGNQALAEYQSKLDAIGSYIGNKAGHLNTVAAAAGKQNASITGYNPVGEIASTLGNNSGFNAAAGGISSTIGGSGYSSPTSTGGRAIVQAPNQSVLDQFLYPQPLYA